MQILHNTVLDRLSEYLQSAINKLASETEITKNDIYNSITPPPNHQMGHLAFACFSLSKILKKNPAHIAQDLAAHMPCNDFITELKPMGPYLNFFLSTSELAHMVIPSILDKTFFVTKIFDNQKKIMVEYSQPNTHKELHVGHMRNVCLGNALVRLNRYAQNEVIAANYIGDVGTHVAKCLWYLDTCNTEKEPEQDKGTWIGKMYTLATQKLEELKGTENELKAKELITAILKELESKQGPYYDLWEKTKMWSMELFQQTYKWADIEFDKWYFESDVDSSSLQLAHELYQKGFFHQSEGAIGMDLANENLGFAMMIKSDGTGMYATKDIMLAKLKFEEFNPDLSYYVVDKRQTLHFKQIFKVLEKIGFAQAEHCVHLAYDFVELPDGAMSSRKGNIVPLTTLIDQMENTIRSQFLKKYEGSWTENEIDQTSRIIANGAIKYGMLRMDEQRKIIFDLQEWLKLDGETGPYLQYVYARINSMQEKFSFNPSKPIDWSVFETPQETALILKLCSFNDVVEKCIQNHKTSSLCSFLFDLGKLFNNFYAACPIGKAADQNVQLARLSLSFAVANVMKQGLNLLGIEAPEKM